MDYTFVFLNLKFLAKLDKLIAEFDGLSCTSWGRSIQRNRDVGGAAQSGHVLWLAVDLICDEPRHIFHVARRALELGFSGVELDLGNYHLHLDDKSRIWRVVKYPDDREEPLADYLATQI